MIEYYSVVEGSSKRLNQHLTMMIYKIKHIIKEDHIRQEIHNQQILLKY